MKRFSAFFLILTLSLRAAAEENVLTPKEVAEGWILLFDGKTTFGWTSPNDSKWSVVDGMLAPEKGKVGLLTTTTEFGDYRLSMEIQRHREGRIELGLMSDEKGKSPEFAEGRMVRNLDPGWWRYEAQVVAGEVSKESLRGDFGGSGSKNKPSGMTSVRSGRISLGGNGFVVRNIKLKPEGAKPLLNGKNLDGWQETNVKKSKFTVTREGFLSLKDGAGDLQTKEQWADFVLQLDCRTNGRNLNSGIFFRCLPDEYQKGYEAQIHNGFGAEKDYNVEVYNPKTNALVEKKKVKSTATDYGTGAIYNRLPARSQAANDNEWFTMTVVARGRHIATWVNGVQMVDWTDHRPLAENGRKGAYLKKGPISIQGHDPTTDLLFRNIRIAELP